jgi:hypothetical protein
MALPVMKHPTFELTVPSTKERLRYRPFLVKEEKILLLAQQSGQSSEMIHAVKQIISNCMIEGNIDIERSPTFDVEYMFLKLRSNSISDAAKFRFMDEGQEEPVEVEIDLDDVEVKFTKGHSNQIKVNEDILLEMKYPTYDDLSKSVEDDKASAVDITFDMISRCVDKVYEGSGDEQVVYQFNDFSVDEQKEFIDGLSSEAFKSLQSFFEKLPKLTHDVKYKVGKKTKTRTFSGIADFFQSA